MDYGLWHVERRDTADRDEFAQAALSFCRAVRGLEGVSDCRFFWKPFDVIVVLAEGETAAAWRVNDTGLAAASFALFDLGKATGYEEWLDAKTSEQLYRSAGR